MASLLANNFLEQILKKEIDFDTDTIKVILMGSSFTFNRVTHVAYSDVSASELTTQYGYTAGGLTLAGVAIAQNDTLNAGTVIWSNATWTATGGDLSTTGAIIYDDTTIIKYIIGYIDFGGLQTTANGGTCTISAPTVAITG